MEDESLVVAMVTEEAIHNAVCLFVSATLACVEPKVKLEDSVAGTLVSPSFAASAVHRVNCPTSHKLPPNAIGLLYNIEENRAQPDAFKPATIAALINSNPPSYMMIQPVP